MKPLRKMNREEREFFSMVALAAFANPFSSERMELDRKVTGVTRADLTREEMVQQVTVKVAERLRILEASGRADLSLYQGEERRTVGVVFLFTTYHRFRNEFDAFIPKQVAAGDAPCKVPFAGDVLAMLAHLGFTEAEALKYFALYYQFRRAFYFIESGLAGASSSMHRLRLNLWNNVFTNSLDLYDTHLWDRMEDFSTLLLGETGTGKGAAAAAIGRSCFIPYDPVKSQFVESFTRNFISLNLSQYPETLIESELFGHRKGAFTGAVENYEGIFSRCTSHGSIFLDEIGDISIPVQIKLLQVLQERTFSAVGSHDRLRFHGRVIAATNRPLDEMRRRGQFRDDFYYRLCSDTIVVPSLRERITEEPRELEVMVQVESAEKDLQSANEKLLQVQARLKDQNIDLNNESDTLNKDLENLESERKAVVSDLEGQAIKAYDQLRQQKRGVAVTTLSDNSCEACGTTFTASQQQNARSNSQLFYCPTCGRIIYAG